MVIASRQKDKGLIRVDNFIIQVNSGLHMAVLARDKVSCISERAILRWRSLLLETIQNEGDQGKMSGPSEGGASSLLLRIMHVLGHSFFQYRNRSRGQDASQVEQFS